MAADEGDARKVDEFSLGPFGDDSGVTILDLTKPVVGKITTIKNGLVLEIIDHIPSRNAKETADLLIRLAHPDSSIHQSKPNSLRQKVSLAVKTRTNLRKNKKTALPDFLSKEFVPPVTVPPPPPPPIPVKRSYEELESENAEIKQEIKAMETEQKQMEEELKKATQTSEQLIQELETEISNHRKALASCTKDHNKLKQQQTKLQRSFEAKSNELDKANFKVSTLRENLTKKSTAIKTLNKKVSRASSSVNKKVKKLKELETVNKEINTQVKENEDCIQVQTELLEKAKKERREALKSLNQIRIRAQKDKDNIMSHTNAKIKELKNKAQEDDTYIRELEHLNLVLQDEVIHTFEDGKFVNELRETIMILLTECNVSMSNVPKVINTVCKNLLGKIPDRLPSKGTLHRILTEAKFVAQNQIFECMAEGGDPSNLTGNTLHSDATTKFHRHYQGFQVTLRNGKQMTIGLTEVGAGDADTYLEAFKDTINEISEAVKTHDQKDTVAQLITSLKNTMGDQGPTNPQFNSKLQELREQLLPDVIDNWDALPESSQKAISEIGNYFCKMHLLVNFATEADKVLKINENDIVESGKNPYAFGTESGAARLVRTAAKAFTEHGCDKSGIAADWNTYLEQQGTTNKMVTYRANRFNILFYDAAATYFHRNHIFNFLSTLPDPNNLLKAVQFDVQVKLYQAQIRALGIIDKIVTGPFWRLIEGTSNILDLNDPLNEMLVKLKMWAVDAKTLLEGEPLFDASKVEIHTDEIYDELFAETNDPDLDTYTQAALEMIVTGIVLILERQAKDQLEGGCFFAPTEQLKESAKNVPTTNTVSERDFAILDILVRLKPAATCNAYETYILWLNNKPSEWLQSMPVEEKNNLLDMARNHYPKIKEQYQARKNKLKQQHIKSLLAKQQKKEDRTQKNMHNKIAATEGILPYGVWTLDTLSDKLDSVEDAKAALIAQLQYQKKVLGAKGSPHLFYKSSQNVQFNEEQLEANLRQVLELNKLTTENVSNNTIRYHPSNIIGINIQKSKSVMSQKIAEQRNKITAKQQQQELPKYLENPESFVGKTVKHKCKEEDGTVEWFTGQVKAVYAKKSNPLLTEYDIIYDDFPDDTWHFPLLKDLKKEDLYIK